MKAAESFMRQKLGAVDLDPGDLDNDYARIILCETVAISEVSDS